jgi:TPR repeat protein
MANSEKSLQPDEQYKLALSACSKGAHVEAFPHFLAAAQGGHIEAQYDLGLIYINGRGAEIDPKQGARWFLSAADHGFIRAQYMIGVYYFHGEGVSQDFVEACKWLMMVSNIGYDRADDYLPSLLAQMAPDQISKAKTLVEIWRPTSPVVRM